MQEAVMTVSSLCMIAALCDQLMQKNRFRNAVRVVLGLEITWVMMTVIRELGQHILERS